MATTFKTLLNDDVVSTRTMLHEAIPITGTIPSGTYNNASSVPLNIKNYSHGYFQSVFDYPYLSSSANHIFDISCGFKTGSSGWTPGLKGPGGSLTVATVNQCAKKTQIYNQFAANLAGYNADGTVRTFDRDGDYSTTGGGAAMGQEMLACYFLNFSRLLVKDEIKKGSFRLSYLTGGVPSFVSGAAANEGSEIILGDYGATGSYKVNSPAGEYAPLYTSSIAPGVAANISVGLIYYQTGIVVLSASIFNTGSAGAHDFPGNASDSRIQFGGPDAGPYGTATPTSKLYNTASVDMTLSGATIQQNADGFRNRLNYVSFNNTVELNSTIYFCRANHNEFNYSANPTYVNASKLVTKNKASDAPVSYITTVGLYSADNELLAVAKLSEPLKKDPSTELTLRVRLDY
jgi:hypothetical protein